jgi:AraC-like DNA-binding protein
MFEQAMGPESEIIASGNLATHHRTVTGLLGQLALLGVGQAQCRTLFTNAGLPVRAMEEPDFPISLEQELQVSLSFIRMQQTQDGHHSPATALFRVWRYLGIEYLGVLGMAMRHAATALEALQVCLTYPQLTWGHSRMVVRRAPEGTLFSFYMERPMMRDAQVGDVDKLVELCLVLDLLSSLRNIEDIVESGDKPLAINLPFPEPPDWSEVSDSLPCPVNFSAQEASLAFSSTLDQTPLPRANPHLYRSFVSIAEKLSRMLAEDISLGERVTRWLWACTPPLRRGEIAAQLAMSERTLTRQLAAEKTSYAALLSRVQTERAKNFLRNPGLSVTEIGYRLGYSEPAAFSRAFSGWTGRSPLRWRAQIDAN